MKTKSTRKTTKKKTSRSEAETGASVAAAPAKLRVHQLARELGVGSKELIERAAEEGLELKNYQALIDETDAARIRGWFGVGATGSGEDTSVADTKERAGIAVTVPGSAPSARTLGGVGQVSAPQVHEARDVVTIRFPPAAPPPFAPLTPPEPKAPAARWTPPPMARNTSAPGVGDPGEPRGAARGGGRGDGHERPRVNDQRGDASRGGGRRRDRGGEPDARPPRDDQPRRERGFDAPRGRDGRDERGPRDRHDRGQGAPERGQPERGQHERGQHERGQPERGGRQERGRDNQYGDARRQDAERRDERRFDAPRGEARPIEPRPPQEGRPAQPPRPERTGNGGGDLLLTPEEMRKLSPSQKRRLRRKRRRERELNAPATGVSPAAIEDEDEALDADDAVGVRAEDPGLRAAPSEPRSERRDARGHEAFAHSDVAEGLEDRAGDDDLDLNGHGDIPDDGDAAVEVEEAPEEAYDAEESAESLDDDERGVEDDELSEDSTDVEEAEARGDLEGETPEEGRPGGPGAREGRESRDGRGRRGRRGRGRDRERRGRYDDRERPVLAADISPDSGVIVEHTGPPTREMIINIVPREECRIALLHRGKLEEIYIERASSENYVSNIYKGIVTNVEPSIQAAFIDFGMGKNGFLHISDLNPNYFPNSEGQQESVGRKLPRKYRPPIQKCLRRGQEIIVQVNKEGIGTKGPTLSTYLSIPGRFVVMMPGMKQLGVSRRIEDEDQRRQLRGILNQLELPDGMGFIARTAAVGRTVAELQGDLNYLTRLWRAVEQRRRHDRAPCELFRESDLVIRTIRDVFTADIGKIIVDDPDVVQRARDFLSIFNPSHADIIVEYREPEPIFHRYGIEAELERLHSRHVPLPSGGSLVIDQTEALVAIDVNSGKYRTEEDAETTAYKIDLEAADEIPRQLRLRDLGGVIVCDFIDVRMESHRREIERRLIENLRKHKERCKVLRMSSFGIIEMTRQRQRASLQRSVYRDCHFCRGTGLIKTAESVALDVMRLIQLAVTRDQIHTIEVLVSPEVAYLIQNRKRKQLADLEAQYRRLILIRGEQSHGLDQVELRCMDARGRVVAHP